MKRNHTDRCWRAPALGAAAVLWAGCFTGSSLAAQSAPDLTNAGALFLLLPMGAQGVGMGQVGVTLQGRGEAVFWNPAGLATMTSGEFSLNSASLAAGPATAVTLFFPKRSIGVFGAGVYLLDFGSIDATTSDSQTVGRISPRNIEYLASFATAIGAVNVGVTYKLVQLITGVPGAPDASTHAFDVGTQVAFGETGALQFGAALKNVGFKLQVNNEAQSDPLPAQMAFGVLYRIDFHPATAGGGQTSLAIPDSGAVGLTEALNRVDLKVAADVDRPWDNSAPPEMRIGIDLGYRDLIRLRSGYAFTRQGLSGPSVGMGLHTGSIALDFARTFMTGTDLLTSNPTFISFRLVF